MRALDRCEIWNSDLGLEDVESTPAYHGLKTAISVCEITLRSPLHRILEEIDQNTRKVIIIEENLR